MLRTVATIEAVAASLDLLAPGTPVVLDPVMVSESGAELLEASARGALMTLLLPRVQVITPNLPEARALAAAAAAAGAGEAAAAGSDTTPAVTTDMGETGDDAGALARALHATVDIDDEIPVEHYQAVAEVIGYVMQLKRGFSGARR